MFWQAEIYIYILHILGSEMFLGQGVLNIEMM